MVELIAIDRIAEDRAADVFEVDPDLMGAACERAYKDKAELVIESEEFHIAHSVSSICEYGHFFPVDWMASNGGVDETAYGPTAANGEIELFHLSIGKHFNQFLMGSMRFRCNENH